MSYEYMQHILNYLSIPLVGSVLAATTAKLAVWLSTYTDEKPVNFCVSLEDQSVEIEPGVRASKFAADGKLIDYYFKDVRTTHDALVRGLKVSNNGPCIGTRRPDSKVYEWISYQEIYDQAKWTGSAFIEKGLIANDATCVGIYSPNCLEWVLSEEACSMYSMAVVPLYDTLGTEACEYIINQTEMKLVICDTGPKAFMLVQAALNMTSLTTLVVIQATTLTDDIINAGKDAGIEVVSFQHMMEIGRNCTHSPVLPKPETICTICYTSGTTGNPKGVIVSHQAMIANISAAIFHVDTLFNLSSDDVHLSYLPLAHMYERLNQLLILQHGARIGFNSGDIRLLLEDLAILKPTFFPTVPRLLNRIFDKIQQNLAGNIISTFLFNLAINRKLVLLKRGIVTKNTIWDYLVFRRIQNLLGGNVRVCTVGSAPLSEDVLNFTRSSFGCYVFEGYGQTEVTAGAAMTLPHEWQAGIVGPPLVCAHIKLADIPEMDYFATANKGEICIRSSCGMSGYYKDCEKTREAIDEDGWIHTGDVGQWLPNGVLKIIDRKKHIFKLAQGEYIAPEKIESIYARSRFISQIFVDGDSFQTFPVAVIVPDKEVVCEWANNEMKLFCPFQDLCSSQLLKKAIFEDITKLGVEAKLKGFEQVKDIHLTSELFTVENGLLTPTLKSKRPILRRHFDAEIHNMYQKYQK